MKGAFVKSQLIDLYRSKRIIGVVGFEEKHIDVASVDLTVDVDNIYEVKDFVLPNKFEKVRDVLNSINHKKIDPKRMGNRVYNGKFEKNHSYLCKSSVDVNLPSGIYAYSNAKSTSGRSFIFVRTVCDYISAYDTVGYSDARSYTGEVWLLIIPLAYGIYITDLECYAQLRLFNQDTRFKLNNLKTEMQTRDLFLKDDNNILNFGDTNIIQDDGSLLLPLYLKANSHVGYVVKENITDALDLTSRSNNYNIFFEDVIASSSDNSEGVLTLMPGKLYLLRTEYKVNVPVDRCAELKAIDMRLGMFFSHFAGFIDPGFQGTITLEVMAPYGATLRHGDPVARLVLENTQKVAPSYADKGNYQGQIDTKLPKQFKK